MRNAAEKGYEVVIIPDDWVTPGVTCWNVQDGTPPDELPIGAGIGELAGAARRSTFRMATAAAR